MATDRLIAPSYGSHFYKPDGTPVYTVPYKDPKRAGQERPCNVADAKELGLLPSVTTILGMLHRHSLQAWIEEQLILAALRTPRNAGELDLDYAHRLIEEGRSVASTARDFGVYLHDLIAIGAHLASDGGWEPVLMGMPEDQKFTLPFIHWALYNNVQPVMTETCMANVLERYGGRIDCIGLVNDKVCVIDWKTQRTKPGEKINHYPEVGMQLAAYGEMAEHWPSGPLSYFAQGRPTLLSVVISSTEPGRIEAHEWENPGELLNAFYHCRDLYYSCAGPGKDL